MNISRGRAERLRLLVDSMRLWWSDAPSGAWLLAVGGEIGVAPRQLVDAAVACAHATLDFVGCNEPLGYEALQTCAAWAGHLAPLADAERAVDVALAGGRLKRLKCDAPLRVIDAARRTVRVGAEVEHGRRSRGDLVRSFDHLFRTICAARAEPDRSFFEPTRDQDPHLELLRVRIGLLCEAIPSERRARAAVLAGAATLGALARYLDADTLGPSPTTVAAKAVRAVEATQRVAEVATMSAFYLSFGPDELCDGPEAATERIRALKAAAEVTLRADAAWAVRNGLMARVKSRRAASGPTADLVEASLIAATAALSSAEAVLFGVRNAAPLRSAIERHCAAMVRRRVPFELVFSILGGRPTAKGANAPGSPAREIFGEILRGPAVGRSRG